MKSSTMFLESESYFHKFKFSYWFQSFHVKCRPTVTLQSIGGFGLHFLNLTPWSKILVLPLFCPKTRCLILLTTDLALLLPNHSGTGYHFADDVQAFCSWFFSSAHPFWLYPALSNALRIWMTSSRLSLSLSLLQFLLTSTLLVWHSKQPPETLPLASCWEIHPIYILN